PPPCPPPPRCANATPGAQASPTHATNANEIFERVDAFMSAPLTERPEELQGRAGFVPAHQPRTFESTLTLAGQMPIQVIHPRRITPAAPRSSDARASTSGHETLAALVVFARKWWISTSRPF